jgi:CRP-like cAMP-binding protein
LPKTNLRCPAAKPQMPVMIKIFPVMDNFFGFVDSVYPISGDCKKYLGSVIRNKVIEKREYILREGEICNKIGFIESGCLKSYSTKGERDSNIWFWFTGDVFTSTTSFFEQEPSRNFIQAVTRTKFWYLTHDSLEYAYKNYPETNVVARILLQKYYAMEVKRIELLKGTPALDRYKFLVERHPEILENLNSTEIASYLDISKFRLSQIRHELSRVIPSAHNMG